MGQCAARRSNGEPCKAQAVRGKRVCRVHGGMTPSGMASPHYKDGRYSKVLPSRLSVRYEAARRDTRLLELADEIALLDTRLAVLVGALDTGESTWADLSAAYGRLRGAMNRGDKPAITAALTEVDRIIVRGGGEQAAWEQIGAVLEQRRKLVESERKRLVEAQQTITTEQAMLFVHAVLASVKEHIADRAALSAIQSDVMQLLTRDNHVIDVSATTE